MSWKNFTIEEFACRCGKCENKIKPEIIDFAQQLRNDLGFPLIVTSGYRCPSYNNQVSTTGLDGPHTTGLAMDIAVDRVKAHELVQAAMFYGARGLGIMQKGPNRFVHLDLIQGDAKHPRPTIWSY